MVSPASQWHTAASFRVANPMAKKNAFDDDPTAPVLSARGGGLKLLFVGEGIVRAFTLPGGHTSVIGRGLDADIVIDDASLSRRHATIEIAETGIAIADLGSSNGTWVQSRRITGDDRVLIQPGDSFRVGHAVLLVNHAMIVDRLAQSEMAPPAATSDGPVVASPRMEQLHAMIAQVAPAPISVLLLGETGVGKDVLARALHARSDRSSGPFIAINCPALPANLVESELFGHEKGAFTGADTQKIGLLEAADGGTVFLDEVGELPPLMQAKLLRVLEDRQVLRVGSKTPRPVDVRFVSATNRDLEQESRTGGFRQDLFFRLNGVALEVPPLRQRQEELAPLAEHFLESYCVLLKRTPVPTISATAHAAMGRHPWPGNIRELRNAMERALLLCGTGPIGAEHLPFDDESPSAIITDPTSARAPALGSGATLGDTLESIEKQRILDALKTCAGNQTRAAKALGISRRGLGIKLDKYGIKRPRKPRGDGNGEP